ncbi:MAG: GGDEF domain-containing protein [Acidobacteria bacterium]|nr:GGDEF domain-containing protein [Acidobacteriota bacterium]
MHPRKPPLDFFYVYESTPPELPVGPAPFHAPHLIERGDLFLPRLPYHPECRLALIPYQTPVDGLGERVRRIFPNARLVTYSTVASREIEEASARNHFSLHVYLPLSASLLDCLYRNLVGPGLRPKPAWHAPYAVIDGGRDGLRNLSLKEDYHRVCHEFAHLAKSLLNCDLLFLFLENRKTRRMELAYSDRDGATAGFEPTRIFPGLTLAEDPDCEATFVLIPDMYPEPGADPGRICAVQPSLAYAFRHRSGAGFLVAVNKTPTKCLRTPEPEQMRAVCLTFIQIDRNVRACDEARRLAIVDDLTSLFNFRFLRRYLATEIRCCAGEEKNLSILFIDIDNFKRVNDTYGHIAGSAVLCEMGNIFRRTVRNADMIARYGGDEFVIVFPGLVLEDAFVIGERLRHIVEKAEFHGDAGLNMQLTISIGVAAYPANARSAETLLKRADAAMYAAKEAGKNKIVTAGQ